MTLPDRLKKLRECAEKARDTTLSGSWRWDNGHIQGSYLSNTMITLGDTYEDGPEHAAYIETLSPDTALKLLDLIERQREYLAAIYRNWPERDPADTELRCLVAEALAFDPFSE